MSLAQYSSPYERLFFIQILSDKLIPIELSCQNLVQIRRIWPTEDSSLVACMWEEGHDAVGH